MIFLNTAFDWKDITQFVDFLQTFQQIFKTKMAELHDL
jgi:hypothetical protein